MSNVHNVGSVISELRKAKGVTQEDVAKYVGVSAQAVSKWENGGVPDTELLPKIADYFDIPIDMLFGRDYSGTDLSVAILECIRKHEPRSPMRYREAFELCWDIERSLFSHNGIIKDDAMDLKQNRIADYENRLPENGQTHSTMVSDHGFTRMGVANRMQYFLLVPEIKNKETALFAGIDYPAFFACLSQPDVFQALLLLYSRDDRKAFTENLLVNGLSIDLERAKQIIEILYAMNLVAITKLELDDEIKDVYRFVPNTAFIALLIFAREMIDRPNTFSYQSGFRTVPFL